VPPYPTGLYPIFGELIFGAGFYFPQKFLQKFPYPTAVNMQDVRLIDVWLDYDTEDYLCGRA
jgi:hypothetical protein